MFGQKNGKLKLLKSFSICEIMADNSSTYIFILVFQQSWLEGPWCQRLHSCPSLHRVLPYFSVFASLIQTFYSRLSFPHIIFFFFFILVSIHIIISVSASRQLCQVNCVPSRLGMWAQTSCKIYLVGYHPVAGIFVNFASKLFCVKTDLPGVT